MTPVASGPPKQVSDFEFVAILKYANNANKTRLFPSDTKQIIIKQSLFDSLRVEQNSVMDNSYSQKQPAPAQRQINSNLSFAPNQSVSFAPNQSVCDSYLNQSNFNVSR